MPPSYYFPVLVEGARDYLDDPIVDAGADSIAERSRLASGQPTLIHDDVDAPLEFVLGLVPLLLGDHHPKIGVGE